MAQYKSAHELSDKSIIWLSQNHMVYQKTFLSGRVHCTRYSRSDKRQFSVISRTSVWRILLNEVSNEMSDFLSDFSVIMFASLNVKLIMNGTWTWWVIHDGVWVDGGEPLSDWSIQNLAWRLQNDSTLWKREKIKKMKNAWKYKRFAIIKIFA